MSTEKNLRDAFAGESQANRKYLAFAKKADEEGYPTIAKLFRATAEAETIHAHAHLKALGEIKSTKENLEAAVQGETYEFEEMYPEFIETAKTETNNRAQKSFELANEAERVHGGLFTKALEAMENKEDMEFYLCEVCGNIEINEVPEKCRICNAPSSKFAKIS